MKKYFIIKKFLCIPTYSLFHFGKSYYVRIKEQMLDLYKDRLSVLNITKHQTRSITALFFFVIFSDISSRILIYQYGRPNFDVTKKADLPVFTLIFLLAPLCFLILTLSKSYLESRKKNLPIVNNSKAEKVYRF